MYTISKEFHFSASHRLEHLPEDHQCHRLHGHNYIVVVKCKALTLDGYGFVTDYGDLSPVKKYIDEHLDHRHLNDVLGNGIATTAENIARHIYNKCLAMRINHIYSVAVSETPKTWAEYTPR